MTSLWLTKPYRSRNDNLPPVTISNSHNHFYKISVVLATLQVSNTQTLTYNSRSTLTYYLFDALISGIILAVPLAISKNFDDHQMFSKQNRRHFPRQHIRQSNNSCPNYIVRVHVAGQQSNRGCPVRFSVFIQTTRFSFFLQHIRLHNCVTGTNEPCFGYMKPWNTFLSCVWCNIWHSPARHSILDTRQSSK